MIVLGKLSVPGRPTVSDNSRQAPVALTVSSGGCEVCSDIFSCLSFLSLFLPLSRRRSDID